MSYELQILTPNGVIIGSYDDYDDANDLYKFAKRNDYVIVARKVDDFFGEFIEKRFIQKEYEACYESALRASIEGLEGTISRMKLELDRISKGE